MDLFMTELEQRQCIDRLLSEAKWDINDCTQVLTESGVFFNKFKRPDYILLNNEQKPLAIIELKHEGTQLNQIKEQILNYAQEINVQYIFLVIGQQIFFWDYTNDDAHQVNSFFSRQDLERRLYIRTNMLNLNEIPFNNNVHPLHERIIRKIECDIMQGVRRRFLVELPTGMGKTSLVNCLVDRLLKSIVSQNILIICDNFRVIYMQIFNRLKESIGQYYNVCLLKSGEESWHYSPINATVYISTFDHMRKIKKELTSGFFDTVITLDLDGIDYKKWQSILFYFDAYNIGFSSVSSHYLSNEICDFYYCKNKEPFFSYKVQSAIEDNVFVPKRLYGLYDPNLIENSKALFNSKLGAKSIISAVDKIMWSNYRELASNLKNAPGKGLVFAANIYQAHIITEILNSLHPESGEPYASVISMSVDNNDETIRKFTSEQFPQILVCVNMLNTGFSFPDIMHIVICRRIQNPILYNQICIKGALASSNIEKKEYAIYDLYSNYKNLNLDNDYESEYTSISLLNYKIQSENEEKNTLENDYIKIGVKGIKIRKEDYISKWESVVKDLIDSNSGMLKTLKNESIADCEKAELWEELGKYPWEFDEENLGQAYNKPGYPIEYYINKAIDSFKTLEEQYEEKFSTWILSKELTTRQLHYLITIKNIGTKYGKISFDILNEPRFQLLNIIEIGKNSFGEKFFYDLVSDMNKEIFES